MRMVGLPLWLLAVPALLAQPAFEVASLKLATSHELGGVYVFPGGRVGFRGCTLQFLIEEAFNVQSFQVSGGPGWKNEERYDIDAKPPASSQSSRYMPPYSKAPLTAEQHEMVQSLLVTRFHLQYRHETRDGPVYVLSRGNKPLRMTNSKDKNEYPWAGGLRGGGLMGDGLKGINESMDDLAWRLSPYLGRPVLNRTGISGSYDFLADYPIEDGRRDITGMILATIKDLGLKLEVTKGPIDVIVIERAERPTDW
jgi:uncharacterized protein (TIGR03435 family)